MKTCLLACLSLLLGLFATGARAQAPIVLPPTGTVSYTTCNLSFGPATDPSGIYYAPNQSITVVLRPGTPGTRVKLTFPVDHYVEGGYDFIDIYDGVAGGSPAPPLLASITGAITANTSYLPTNADGALTLVFNSDDIVEFPAWLATVSCVPALPPPPRVGIGVTTPRETLEVAGKIFSSAGGFRFPDNSVQTTAAAAQQLSIVGSTISLTNGGAVTVPSSADNLGNHTATQNLMLGANWLSGDGGNEGLSVDGTGRVGVGTSTPAARLDVAGGSGSPALRLSSGTLVLSVATAQVPASNLTLTVTAAVHNYTANSSSSANGTITLGPTGAVEGQTLLLGNFDAQNLPVIYANGTATVAPNTLARFIFLNNGWRLM